MAHHTLGPHSRVKLWDRLGQILKAELSSHFSRTLSSEAMYHNEVDFRLNLSTNNLLGTIGCKCSVSGVLQACQRVDNILQYK